MGDDKVGCFVSAWLYAVSLTLDWSRPKRQLLVPSVRRQHRPRPYPKLLNLALWLLAMHQITQLNSLCRGRYIAAFGGGAVIGALGGLIGLGGAEFRLPLLIGAFRFAALEAVILNKAMSLVVVTSALRFRAGTVPFSVLATHWPIIVNLLAGSLFGAWVGASWTIRMKQDRLYRVIAVLLVAIAGVLVFAHDAATATPLLIGTTQAIAGVLAGFAIGIVAALLGVAGGELLIPTLVLLFGVDIKLAGSLSLAISLPTMMVGFTRYSRDSSFVVLRQNRAFLFVMALGSLAGTFVGGQLLGIVPNRFLLPMLAAILVISAIKVWRHRQQCLEPRV